MNFGDKVMIEAAFTDPVLVTGGNKWKKAPICSFQKRDLDAGLIGTWSWYQQDTIMIVGAFLPGAAKYHFKNEYLRKFNSEGTGGFIHKADMDDLNDLRWRYVIRCPFRRKTTTDDDYNCSLTNKYGIAALSRFTRGAEKIDKYSRAWIDDEVEGLSDLGDKEKYIKQGHDLYIYKKASLRPT